MILTGGRAVRAFAVGAAMMGFASAAHAASGDRDPDFHGGVPLRTAAPPPNEFSVRVYDHLLVDGSNRTYVAGRHYGTFAANSDAEILRLLGNGTLDPGFGPGGSGKATISGEEESGIGRDATGRLLAAGRLDIRRYADNGVLDDTYGTNGLTATPYNDQLVTLPDGSAVLVRANSGFTASLTLTKFDADGIEDPSYAPADIPWPDQTTPNYKLDEYVYAARDSQNRVVLAGISNPGYAKQEIWVMRLKADGTPDPTFGGSGTGSVIIQPAPAGGESLLTGMAIGPNDAIALVGRYRTTVGGADAGSFITLRQADGSPNTTFGTQFIGFYFQKATFQADGKVFVAGSNSSNSNMVIGRYTTDGSLDTTFATQGIATDQIDAKPQLFVQDIVRTSSGKLVIAGKTGTQGDNFDGWVMRYLASNPGAAPPELRSPPTLTGTPIPGETLTCHGGDWANSPTVKTIAFDRAPRSTTSAEDPAWSPVAGTTATTYVVQAIDKGSRLRCREIATNGEGSAEAPSGSRRVDVEAPHQLRAPSVTGTPIVVVGQLACDVGEWSDGPDITVRWLVDGQPIPNQTDRIIKLDYPAHGHVACEVTAANDVGSATATTDTVFVVVDVPKLRKGGDPKATMASFGPKPTDQRLTCAPGDWEDDYGSYDYQWLRDGAPIAGAVGKTRDASVDDLGALLSCTVVSINPDGRSLPATSNQVLVPLPATGEKGRIYQAGGFNRLDPVNFLAVSKQYLDLIKRIAEQQRELEMFRMLGDCASGHYAKAKPPPVTDYKTATLIGGEKLCGILLKAHDQIVNTSNAAYYTDLGVSCRVPDVYENGLHICPTLKLNTPPLNYDALSKFNMGEQDRLASVRPLKVLWDFNADGRTDATCDPSAPILRSLYSRGHYTPRAVIINADSETTGVYSITDVSFAFYPESTSQKGAIRGGQPFACKTSLEPPPEVAKPCINEVTMGRIHLTGNLCPISARRIPESELGGLPAEVQKMLEDQALNGPLNRRRGAPLATPGEGTLGGLPPAPRSVAGELNTQVSALSTLDTARAATIPKTWEDALKNDKDFDLDKAQHAMDQIYIAKGTSFLNGVEMDPIGTASTILVPSDAGEAIKGIKKMTVSSTKIATSLGGIPIGDPGKLTQDFEDRVTSAAKDQVLPVLRGANFDKIADSLKSKLNLGPFKLAGDAKIKLNNDGTATIDAWAELPALLTSPGSAPIRAGVQVNATREGKLSLKGIHLTAPAAYLGAVLIKDLALDYDAGGLSIQGKLLFPPANAGIGINKFRLDGNGRFLELDVDYLAGAGQGIPVGPGLFLTKLGGGLSLNPDEVRARASVSVGPSSGGGCPTAGIDAQFVVHFAPSPFYVDANGDVGIVCIPIANAHFYADSTGYVKIGASVHLDIGIIYLSAAINGQLQLPRWQVDLHGDGGIRHLLSATIKGLIGNLGVAACGRVEVFPETPVSDAVTLAGGAGVRFPGGRPPLAFPELVANVHLFTGCNLSSFSPFGKDVRAAATGNGREFTIPTPAPSVIPLEITGAGGPPKVTLRAPDGKVLDASTFTEDFRSTADVSGMLDPSGSRTLLFVHGQPGTWSVDPVAGSPAIVDIRKASVLPDPKVTGKVGGAGAQRQLKYSVARITGQTVTFVEQSGKGQRVITTVKGGGKGTKAFVTSEGGGSTRKVIAQITQDGLPRDNVTVATFSAPSPRATKARHLKVRRKGSKATATWAKSFYTKSYTVAVQTGDGHRFLLTPTARKVTFGGLSKGEGATVSVTSIAPSGAHGATATAKLKGATHYTGFHNKKRPKVKKHHKKKHHRP